MSFSWRKRRSTRTNVTQIIDRGVPGSRFGEDVMETVASWTARVCLAVAGGLPDESAHGLDLAERALDDEVSGLDGIKNWNVLDIGTGNGVLLHALSRQGYLHTSPVRDSSAPFTGCFPRGFPIVMCFLDVEFSKKNPRSVRGSINYPESFLGRFTNLLGTDYSEGAVELARAVSDREGFANINFMVTFCMQFSATDV